MIRLASKYLSLFILLAVQDSCLAQFPIINNNVNAFASDSGNPGLFVPSIQNTQQSSIPSSLGTFVSSFKNAVDSSPILLNAFYLGQVDIHPFARFLLKSMYIQAYGSSYDPHDLVSSLNQPITETSIILTYPMLVNIIANAMGKTLLAKGLLNDMNAATRGLTLAKEMEAGSQKTVGLNYPESKFQALSDGFVGMLKSLDLFKQSDVHDIGNIFSTEIKLITGESDIRSEGGSGKAGHYKSAWQ